MQWGLHELSKEADQTSLNVIAKIEMGILEFPYKHEDCLQPINEWQNI